MKWNKRVYVTLALFVCSAALYRVVPGRPYGFAPQIAMALFGGAVFRWSWEAFAFPLISLLISDALYQFLYIQGLTPIQGFYSGQWLNYAILSTVVLLGLLFKNLSLRNIALYSFLAPTWYFLLSNFTVWLGSDGLFIPRTWAGLVETYVLGLPFYQTSIWATYFFSALFFGAHSLYTVKKEVLSLRS
jgi:hypothetical protein